MDLKPVSRPALQIHFNTGNFFSMRFQVLISFTQFQGRSILILRLMWCVVQTVELRIRYFIGSSKFSFLWSTIFYAALIFFLFIKASFPFVMAALTGRLMKAWIWKSASHLSSVAKLIKHQENSFQAGTSLAQPESSKIYFAWVFQDWASAGHFGRQYPISASVHWQSIPYPPPNSLFGEAWVRMARSLFSYASPLHTLIEHLV